jgi:BirA family biotin operon repressor/biotin-[acetyl-CoA-carboxylase] ligase
MGVSDHPQGADWRDDGPNTWPSGWTLVEVAETGSTNHDLIERAGSSPHRSVLRTDHQTAGRGRLDRRWDAPAGTNLLASLLFREVPTDPGELMRRVALAAVRAVGDAVRGVTDAQVALKWPNDVLLGGRKLAGLLAQRAPDGSVVVGIGLNLGWAPEGAARVGDHISPNQLLAAMLVAYDALPSNIDALYRSELSTLGQRVRVELPTGDLVGTAIDVERDGHLIVIDECAISHRLSIGDVVHLRPA